MSSRAVRLVLAAWLAWLSLALLAPALGVARHGKSDRRGRHDRHGAKAGQAASVADPKSAPRRDESSPNETQLRPKVVALLDEARSALSAGELDGALKKAESAYKKQPTGETLCLLAQVAAAQNRVVDAHDLFRRCLADPSQTIDPSIRTEAQKLATSAPGGLGDLHVVGDKDSLVFVDDRLRGSLPLLLPVRVAAGMHSVSLLTSGHTSRGKVEMPSGQAREMRFDALTGAVLVSVPPMVVFVQEIGAVLEPALLSALEKGGQLVGYSLALSDQKIETCDGLLPDCLMETARRTQAGYVLAIKTTPTAGGKDLLLSVWDAQVGELAGQESARCAPCTDEAQLAAVTERLTGALRRGRGKPRGSLSVTSIPKAAQIKVGGRLVGQTPWSGSVFAGQQQIELSAPSYEPQALITTVAPGQQASVSALLLPIASAEPGPRGSALASGAPRRPLWRVATGAAAVGVGILLIGIGGSGLAADGTCVPPLQPPAVVCRETIQSATVGGSLLGVGLGLTIGGVVLIGLPPRREANPTSP